MVPHRPPWSLAHHFTSPTLRYSLTAARSTKRPFSTTAISETSIPYAESWLLGPQSTKFYTRTYAAPSPKAAIVFVHGFAEHIGRYTHIHPKFLERGITVFAFDQRGFGRTAQDLKEKSKGSAYGKTGTPDQMEDIQWAVNYVKKEIPDVPVFLMGHSMGGGEVLTFATQGERSTYYSTVISLAGVIASSPLVALTTPPNKVVRWIGGKASVIAPDVLVPADAKAEYLSRDTAFNEAYKQDPLIRPHGSLRGVRDMLSRGDDLTLTFYKSWPKALPVLFLHGTADKVTSHLATQNFHDKIVADDKQIILFPDAYHELTNEPDGVKEKLVDDVASFVEAHLPGNSKPAEATGSAKSHL